MAKRKYLLLDQEKMSLSRRIQTGLPALAFYALVFGLILSPALITKVVGATETGGILLLQVLLIFLLSRFDKWQTKYVINDDSIVFKKRVIKWDEKYTVQFKKSIFLILHKPRFILKSKSTRIVVPMLSKNIERFIARLSYTNKDLGAITREIYDNTHAYYVKNIDVEKQLNKLGKK